MKKKFPEKNVQNFNKMFQENFQFLFKKFIYGNFNSNPDSSQPPTTELPILSFF